MAHKMENDDWHLKTTAKKLVGNIFAKGINVISSLMVFGVNIVINLFLSPIIINNLGAEAYGYAMLANNVAYYFSLIGLALNSVNARFVTVAWHNGDKEKACQYYSTTFLGDIILACILLGCGIVFSLKVEYLFNVSEIYVEQVRLAFIFTFVASAISTITPVLTSGAYVNNSIKTIYFYTVVSQVMKLTAVLILFCMDVKIYYVTLSAIVSSFMLNVLLGFYNKKNVLELKFGIKQLNFSCLKDMVKSGVWILGDTVSSVLISGLSLVYANLMISEMSMGLLSVAVTISSQFLSLSQYLTQCYMPGMLEAFSKNDTVRLKECILKSQKAIGLVLMTPLAGLIIWGSSFFGLWLPQRTYGEIEMIQKLSIISLLPYVVFPTTQSFRQINIVYNKIKAPTTSSFVLGIVELLVVFVIGKLGELDVYILACVTAGSLVLKEILSNFIYSNMILRFEVKYVLMREVLLVVLFLLLSVVFYSVNCLFDITGWSNFFAIIMICGILGYAVSMEYGRRLL